MADCKLWGSRDRRLVLLERDRVASGRGKVYCHICARSIHLYVIDIPSPVHLSWMCVRVCVWCVWFAIVGFSSSRQILLREWKRLGRCGMQVQEPSFTKDITVQGNDVNFGLTGRES